VRVRVHRVLQAGRIRGAALDVFEVEPLPADSALWRLPNVLLSPHCADRTADFQLSAMRAFADNARRYMAGQPLENLVDKARARGRAMPRRLKLLTRCAARCAQAAGY
jgi:phosphoglycerate dehydrogenase-like enzyme